MWPERLSRLESIPFDKETRLSREWRALRRGESAQVRRREIERAYELFLSGDPLSLRQRTGAVRNIVLDSWRRSLDLDLDPEASYSKPVMQADELQELRLNHPLYLALPVIERLLLNEAEDAGFIVALGDSQGRLLWVDGDRSMRTRAEGIGFVPGTDWSEFSVGTSAPGSALTLNHSIQVFGAEHFNRAVHDWSCAAVPVHDPESGSILGVIDITGGETIAEPHVLPLVEATKAAVEAELKLSAMRDRIEREHQSRDRVARSKAVTRPLSLIVLGREQAVLDTPDGPVELGRRHAEIILALTESPKGLTAGALAESVYGDGERTQETLRAEMVRLRRFISRNKLPITIESRPYRLGKPIRVDARDALAAIGRGAHRLALASYGGEVLIGSEAPGVLALRDELEATLRESMLQSAAPEVLYDYAQQWAEHDLQVWETLLQVLPPLSPKRARVVAHLEQLSG